MQALSVKDLDNSLRYSVVVMGKGTHQVKKPQYMFLRILLSTIELLKLRHLVSGDTALWLFLEIHDIISVKIYEGEALFFLNMASILVRRVAGSRTIF